MECVKVKNIDEIFNKFSKEERARLFESESFVDFCKALEEEEKMDYNEIFFKSVDNLLQYRGIKASDFEEDLGLRRGFIGRHLKKRYDCGFDNIMSISSKLGVPINVLTDSEFLDRVKMENYSRKMIDKISKK